MSFLSSLEGLLGTKPHKSTKTDRRGEGHN